MSIHFLIFINMKKLLWLIVIIVTIYILLIFKAPNITTKIEKSLWFSWLTEFVTGTKWNLDKTYTNIPSKSEAYSWIIDIKNNIINWLDTTKEKIDSVRWAVVWAEKKINEVKQTYDKAASFINNANNKLKEAQKTINDISGAINNTWTTN